MKQLPTVSVITIAYNHEKFIGKCIESVLAQTVRDFEQIIVDDGSTDTTAQIVEQYCLKDPRIRLIRHEHIGFYRMSELYNKALAIAKGELIAILDGDDYWPSTKLENQVPAFTDKNTVLTWGKGVMVDEESLQQVAFPGKRYQRMRRVAAIRELLLGCYITSVTVICRKSALKLIGGFRQPCGIHCVDYPTWLALAPLGEFKFIDSFLGYWVKRDTGLSSQFSHSIKWCNCSVDSFDAMPEDLKKQIGLTRPQLIRLLQDRVDNAMGLDWDRAYSKSELMNLFQQHLATTRIHGISPQASLETRRVNLQRNTTRRLIRRAGRKLLYDHDLKGTLRSLRVALACACLQWPSRDKNLQSQRRTSGDKD